MIATAVRSAAAVRPGPIDALDFTVPPALEAHQPPEARGLARDDVRLMVSRPHDDTIVHARFRDLPAFLAPGDVVVVNASATIAAAIDAQRLDAAGERTVLHFSSPAPDDGSRPASGGTPRWAVELRRATERGTVPLLDARAGERVRLAGGARATLVGPLVRRDGVKAVRLWTADVTAAAGVIDHLARHGRPIRYAYLREAWPLAYYQTMFAAEPGSAEMPSASRAFTPDVVRRLERNGVRVVPIVLHAGVASLEADEPPYAERYRVPPSTVVAIGAARARGGRVVAVGTTVVRALETVALPDGRVQAGEGWTDLVVAPERGLAAVDGLLTGFHEPRASHLAMLEALAGRRHLAIAYDAALRHHYLWHEFGDLHLVFRNSRTTSTGRWSDATLSGRTDASSTRMRVAGRYST